MKKLIITALAALALAIPASAKTWDISSGGWGNPSGIPYDGATNVYFLNFDSEYSACQILLTPDMLAGMAPKATSAETTKSKITSISVMVANNGAYVDGGEITINAYADNVDATAFPKDGSTEKYFEYTTDHKASATFDASSDFANALNEGVDPAILTINFGEEGFIYEGKSILLTVFNDYALQEYYDWYNGMYTFTSDNGEKLTAGAVSDTYMPELTGNALNTSSSIPYILFDYEEVTESNGPTVTPGAPVSDFAIGTKDLDTNCSNGQLLPLNPNYAESVSQSLYTPEMLIDLFTADGSSTTKAAINSITTSFEVSGFYGGIADSGEYPLNVTVYAFNTDAASFPNKDAKPQWFDYTDSSVATGYVNCSEINQELYGEGEIPVTVTFDEPFIYEGKSIILTWVMSSPDYEGFEGTISGCYTFNPKDGLTHSGVISGNSSVSGDLAGTTNSLPYLEIDYTPMTYSGGETVPVLAFAEATPSLAVYTDAKGEKSNYVKIDYTIADDTDLGEYTIKYGTKVIGKGGKTGTIDFIPFTTKNSQSSYGDVTLFVEADGYLAGNITIAGADINALFTAPVANETPLATSLTGEYDVTRASKISVAPAAVITMTSAVPVAKATFTGATLIYGDNTYGLDEYLPAAASEYDTARDFETADGTFGIYGQNIDVPIVHKQPQIESFSYNWNVTPIGKYPCIGSATPTLNGAIPAATSTGDIEVKGASIRINITGADAIDNTSIAEDTHRTLTVVLDDPEYLIIIAGHDHTVKYHVYDPEATPDAPAENGIMTMAEEADGEFDNVPWTETGKTLVLLPKTDLAGKAIKIATFDAKDNMMEKQHLYIADDGKVSGIEDITVDNAGSAQYYNLQGIRVANPESGLYIRRQGNTATKVYVK